MCPLGSAYVVQCRHGTPRTECDEKLKERQRGQQQRGGGHRQRLHDMCSRRVPVCGADLDAFGRGDVAVEAARDVCARHAGRTERQQRQTPHLPQ